MYWPEPCYTRKHLKSLTRVGHGGRNIPVRRLHAQWNIAGTNIDNASSRAWSKQYIFGKVGCILRIVALCSSLVENNYCCNKRVLVSPTLFLFTRSYCRYLYVTEPLRHSARVYL